MRRKKKPVSNVNQVPYCSIRPRPLCKRDLAEDYLKRPALFRPSLLNPFQHGVSLMSYLLRWRTTYATSNRLIGSLSWWLGYALRLGRLRRPGRGYGRYYLYLKGATLDYVETNRFLYAEAAQ